MAESRRYGLIQPLERLALCCEGRHYGLIQPLNLDQILQEAQQRWLRPTEICEILRNHQKFRLTPEPPNRPPAGSLFLFDRKVLRYFRKDGHRWRKKKDGRTIKEAHEKLKAGSVDVLHCYYAHGEDNENFQRRSYWMIHEQLDNIVLVHYREVKEGSKLDASRLLNAVRDPGAQLGSAQTSSAPSLEQTYSPLPTVQTSYGPSLISVDWSEQTSNASSPNVVEWNDQTLCSTFEDRDSGKDPGTSSLALVRGSVPHNALPLADTNTGLLELSSCHPDAGFLGTRFNLGGGLSMGANIHGSSVNLYHIRDQRFYFDQLNAPDFLTHKLTDDSLDSYNTVEDVSGGDMIIRDRQGIAQEQDLLLLQPHSQTDSGSLAKLPSTAKVDAPVGKAKKDEAGELKKLDSFGRWMDKEIGRDCDDSLMASDSGGNYWNTLDTETDKEVSSLSHHMQLNIDSMGPSLSQDQLFSISDFAPDWAYSGVETKVLITGTFLGERNHSDSFKWCCMFGEIEAYAEVLADNVLRCQVPFHAPGRVPLYITCSNRLACSEVREFEYREKPSEASSSVPVKTSPEEEVRFQVRLATMLGLGSQRKWLSCPVIGCDKCKLKKNIASLNTKSKIHSEMVENAIVVYEGYSLVTPGDALIQNLLKGRLYEWLVCKVHEGGKGPHILDNEGQGLIHLAAALGFAWAMDPIVAAGVSPNFRDARGKTALHWASYYGREETVLALVRLGAAAGAVDDPTSASPGGQTAADLASSRGYKGIAGFLAEADLTSHLSSLTVGENSLVSAAANIAAEKAMETAAQYFLSPPESEEENSLRGSLAAVRKSAHAAALIQTAFRVRSFRHRQLTKSNHDISESSVDLVALGSLTKVQKVSHFEDYLHSAAIKIQQKYRGWKDRKYFLRIRNRVVKIQAHVRGHQARKQYKKVVWSVSIVEKAILRWRRKSRGLRGFHIPNANEILLPDSEKNDEHEFLRIGRKQKFAGVEKALARVHSMVRNPEARHQYMRLFSKLDSKLSDAERSASCQADCTE